MVAHPHPVDAVDRPAAAPTAGVSYSTGMPVALGAAVQRLHQFLAAAPDVAGEPAPELELAVDRNACRPSPSWKRTPFSRIHTPVSKLLRDQDLGQVRVAAVFGQPADIVVILFLGVGADIDICQLVVADVGNEPREVVEAVIDDAQGAAGKGRVAAAPVLRRDFEHQHRGAVLPRRQRGAGRRVAGADDDHVMLGNVHAVPPARSTDSHAGLS